jgi:hypothetical protein
MIKTLSILFLIMSYAVAPIQGLTPLNVGNTVSVSDATAGGVWSSDNTGVATISVGGLVTAIAPGTANIVYTVGGNSIAAPVVVSSIVITNGFNQNEVYNALYPRVLWQALGTSSQSNRYFEDFHPLNDTNILLSVGRTGPYSSINDSNFIAYLVNESRSVIMQAINAVWTGPQIINPAKLVFYRPDVMLVPQPVQSIANSFCGIKMLMGQGDRAYKFSRVSLFFTANATVNLYLYNDMTLPPIVKIPVNVIANQQTIFDLSTNAIMNYLTPSTMGGIVYFGYFPEDLPNGCEAVYYNVAPSLFNGCTIWSYSAPTYIDDLGQRNFQRNNIGSNNLTYGMNLEVEIYKDATNNIIQNRSLFDDVIGNLMSIRTVKNIAYTYRTGGLQLAVQSNPEVQKLMGQMDDNGVREDVPYILDLGKIAQASIRTAKAGFNNKPSLGIGIPNTGNDGYNEVYGRSYF